MKTNILTIMVASLLVFGIYENVVAEPVTYILEGTVYEIGGPNPDIVAGLIANGDKIEFTFECDLEADAIVTRYNGQIWYPEDYSNDAGDVDYFWCEYLGGTDIGHIGAITAPNPNYFADWKYGLNVSRKDKGVIVQNTGYMKGGSGYNRVSIDNYYRHVQDWKVGENLGGLFISQHTVRNQADEWARIRAYVQLVYFSVIPSKIQDIIDKVVDLTIYTDLSESDANPLLNTLDDAYTNVIGERIVATIDKLEAFIKATKRVIKKGLISEEEGLTLIGSAQDIIDQLRAK